MARHSQADIAALEAQIGPRGAMLLTTATRGLVQSWCIGKGLPSRAVKPATLIALQQAYNSDDYLNEWIERVREDGVPQPQPKHWPPFQPAQPQPQPAQVRLGDVAAKLADLAAMLAQCDPQSDPGDAADDNDGAAGGEDGGEGDGGDNGGDDSQPPRHYVYPRVLAWLRSGANVMLVGPAGSGKTTLGEQLAADLGRDFYVQGAALTKYEYSGFLDANGNYQPTAFYDAFTKGGLLLLDELDGSAAAAVNFLNAALANGYCAFPDGMAQRHPDFLCLAACNTYGRGADRIYVGRNQLDGAGLDRFVTVTMDYDADLERRIAGDTKWTRHVQAARAAVADLGIRHIVSPRASIAGNKGLATGLTWADCEQDVLWKGLDAAQVERIVAKMGADNA